MNRKRDTSYKHCYNLIVKLLEIQDFKNVNINIVNNTDEKIKLDIKIDDKCKQIIYNKKLKKEKKILNSASYNNLKNSKKVLSDGKHNEKNKNSIDININEIVNKHLHENVIYDIIKNIKNKIILNNSINEEISSEVISSNETILENKNIISQNNVKIENKNDLVDSGKDLFINDNKIQNKLDVNENSGINQNNLILENKNIISRNNDELKSDSDIYEEDDDSIIDLPEPCDDCDETRRICNENYEVAMKYKEDLEKEQKVNNFLLKEINYKIKIIEELKSKNNKKDEMYIDFITKLNANFMELFLINRKSFNYISDIILSIEKSNPKKIHEIINKNIKKYRNDIQAFENETEDIKKGNIEINTKISNKFIKN